MTGWTIAASIRDLAQAATDAPADPPGWVPAAIVGAVLIGLWIWAYVSRRRARRR